MKHPFSFLRESEYFPHARTLRTSLWQKFKDSFRVLHGDMHPGKDQEPTFGIFDICFLGIPTLIALADNEIQKRDFGQTIKFVSFAVDFLFNAAPRAIFSAILALIAFIPITLPVFLVSKFIDSLKQDSLKVALSLETVTRDDRINKRLSLDDELKKSLVDYDIENIQCTKTIGDRASISYSDNKTFSYGPLFTFSPRPDKDNPAIKAFFSHNIGGIAVEFPEYAKELAEEEISAPKLN